MVHVLVAIATRIAVATVIPIVPCNEITLCLFVCLLFVCMPCLLFIYYLLVYLFICKHHRFLAYAHIVCGTVYHQAYLCISN